MLVISDLVAGHQCAAHAATGLLPFSTASQMVTAKTPPLPPVFVCISLQDPTVVVKVASIPADAPSRLQLRFLSGASFQQSASVSQFMPWTFVECVSKWKTCAGLEVTSA